jgi:carboxyl-terminal processing protease
MRRLAAIIVPALLLCCGGWATSHSVARPASESLSLKDRIEVFETVWQTINDDYYDSAFNGVDWAAVRGRYRARVEAAKTDAEFYALVKQMLRELHDLHTGFAAPDDQPLSNGLSVNEVEGQVVVVRLEPDSEAARVGVQVGMIVRTLGGKPSAERIAKLRAALEHSSSAQADRLVIYNSFLSGQMSEPLRLGLERADGTQFEAVLTRRVGSRPSPTLISQSLPSGFHYLKINTLRSPVAEQFKSKFASFKGAPGLVIDLRGISGGDIHDVGLKIANYFFPTKVSFGRFVNRSGEAPLFRTLRAGGGSQIYKGSVVILVDEATRSAGEVFANGFQENGRALIIGQQSCGCVADTDSKKVKGGGVLQYSHLGYTSGKGHKLEGVGVMPDKIVPLTIAALRQGRDVILEEAEHILKSR